MAKLDFLTAEGQKVVIDVKGESTDMKDVMAQNDFSAIVSILKKGVSDKNQPGEYVALIKDKELFQRLMNAAGIMGKDDILELVNTDDKTVALKSYQIQKDAARGTDVYVSADSYEAAKKWFHENIVDKGADVSQMEIEMDEEADIYISKIAAADEPPLVHESSRETGEVLDMFYNKGYDYDSESYVFTVLKVETQKAVVQATSPDEAMHLMDGKWDAVAVERQNLIVSAPETRFVTVEGETMEVMGEEQLEKALREQFPDGITVKVEDESVANLLQYQKYMQEDDELEWHALNGMIEVSPDTCMAAAHGLLNAELRLKPEDYCLLDACDRTYYSSELSDVGLEVGVNATTVMLNSEEDLKEARVQAWLNPAVLNSLYIEGQPYEDVLDLIKNYDIRDDKSIMTYFNHEFNRQQPEWKVAMAKESARPEIQKFWVEKMGPVYREEREMYLKTRDQAAQEYGYESGNDYQRDIEWTKNASQQQEEKFRAVAKRWDELMQPYRQKSMDVAEQKEYKESSIIRSFIERFDRKAAELVTDVRIIQRLNSEQAVRCKIDGEQQMGKTLSREESAMIAAKDYPKGFFNDLAQKYFKDDILQAMQQEQSRGLRR